MILLYRLSFVDLQDCSFRLFSLLGQGYKLDDLVEAAEETRKIRASRRASMKGTWNVKFRNIVLTAFRNKKYPIVETTLRAKEGSKAMIFAAKSG